MNKKQLLESLKDFQNKSILVLGDLMLDEYHWCEVSRISPEAPVPVCHVSETTLVPGGASNVALNIQSLGAKSHMAGTIGEDSSGDKLLDILGQDQINIDAVIQDKEKPTILKSRIMARQQQMVRVDRESSSPISQKVRNAIFNTLQDNIQNYDAILLSDYLKGTLPESFIQRVIKLANEHNKIVVVDPKGHHFGKYKGAYTLTPNFKEFQEVISKPIQTEKEVEEEAIKLVKRLNLSALLVTRSEKGMSIISKDLEKIDIPTRAREVYDITGAGDTVIATLTIALACGASMETAAHLANYAAGLVVAKRGTSTISFDELKTEIEKI